MGKRKRHAPERQSLGEQLGLGPHITRGLLAIFLLVAAGISALSFFGQAGVAGMYFDTLLSLTFGEVRYVFPIVLAIVGLLVVYDLQYSYRSTHFIGFMLFFLSFNGLVHLQNPGYERALMGKGGGMFGYALSQPLSQYMSYWGATVILIGLLLAALIFLFNTSLAQLVSVHRALFLGFGWVGRGVVKFFGWFKRENPAPNSEVQVVGEHDEEVVLHEAEQEAPPIVERRPLKKPLPPEPEPAPEDNPEPEESTDENTSSSGSTVIRVEKPKRIYELPTLDLLSTSKSKPTSGDIKGSAQIIQETFKNFGIEVDMGEVRVGPTVTQFSFKPARGVKLTRITGLSNDLALALAAHPIRIEAPIPGKSLVGVEVPNQKVAMVTLRELLESQEFKQRPHNMMVALGKDVSGKVSLADLPKMPHLLVAGTTGSGKTVGINTIILSLIYQNTPDTLRFIMVDPKRVELTMYNGIPHLLTPVITDATKTVNALKWAIGEMERRFDRLSAAGKRDIGSYNKNASEPLPYIVFVVDELADLMAMAGKEIEAGIIRLAQMARAVGIHLVVATQRPSVEVITGLMKANIPARMAFAVASIVDSRTILDSQGADKLLGRGDMLLLTPDLSQPRRLQGAYVSEEEMKHVVDFLKGDEPPEYDESIVSKNNASGLGSAVAVLNGENQGRDMLFEEAKTIILESGKASASLLQRRMKVGYARAARLLDELEAAGIVGPVDGAKPREVFAEHLAPAVEEEMPDEDQTLGTGGTAFNP